MGRNPKFSVDQMLGAAAELVVEGGPASLTAVGVARRLSAPSGSVYHRFGSRDELAAALWMRTVERFDREVVSVLGTPGDPTEVAVLAARATVSWTEANPIDALILTMFRREDLIGGELGDRAVELRRRQAAAISNLADRLGREPDEVTFAVAGIPMAAVRGPIERRSPIPTWVADGVERAVRAALADPARPPAGGAER